MYASRRFAEVVRDVSLSFDSLVVNGAEFQSGGGTRLTEVDRIRLPIA